jgi:hypothetical protein
MIGRCVAKFSGVIAGHSRPKDGVASLAYDPAIHEREQHMQIVRTMPVAA